MNVSSSNYRIPDIYISRRKIRNVKLVSVDGDLISLHHVASKPPCNENFKVMKRILENVQDPKSLVTQPDRRGYTPLHFAATAGSIDCVNLLLEYNGDLFAETLTSRSNILHCAAKSGNNHFVMKIMELIQSQQGDIQSLACSKNKNGKLPAHCAAQSGDFITFNQFYNFDKALHDGAKARDGRTYHHLAAERGHLSFLKELFEFFKEKPHLKSGVTKLHHNLLDHAVRSGDLQLLKFVEEKFKNNDNNINPFIQSRNILGWNPMFAAALSFNTDIVDYLLQNNVKIDIVNHTSATPLICAAHFGSLEMVKHLIDNGASINPPCSKPLLHAAAKGGNVDILEYLLNHHNLSNQLETIYAFDSPYGKTRKTILHSAVLSGSENTLKFLIERIPNDFSNFISWIECPLIAEASACGNLEAVMYLVSEHSELLSLTNLADAVNQAFTNRYQDIIKYLISEALPKTSLTFQEKQSFFQHLLSDLSSWCTDLDFYKDYVEEFCLDINPNTLAIKTTPLYCSINDNVYSDVISKYLLSELPIERINTSFLLHAAAKNGNLKLLRYLIEKIPSIKEQINVESHDVIYGPLVPLHIAVNNQHFQIVKFLVEELSANVNFKSPNNLTALHLACNSSTKFSNCTNDIIEYLIKASGWHCLLTRVHTFPNVEGVDLTPYDVAYDKSIRETLEKYSPAILAEKLLITDPSKIIVERSQPLGSGHNASVFKGYYRKTPVAVKIFKQSGTSISQRTLEAMFMREVGLMSTVRHTNLCEIQAAAICGNELMLVMEQMQTSLKDFISDYSKPFPFELKKKIAIDICRGMYALHEKYVLFISFFLFIL